MNKIIKTEFGLVRIGQTVMLANEKTVFVKVRETIVVDLNGTERYVSPSDRVRARRNLH